MSHSSHPYSMRISVIRPWKSRWFNLRKFRYLLREDLNLREFLDEKLRGMFVDAIDIERSPDSLTIIIKTTRPGLIIGRGGEGIEKLKALLTAHIKKLDVGSKVGTKNIKLTVEEVKNPEAHARVMVEQIALDLEKRLPFRRVMKLNLAKMMASREVKGAKVALSGRLDGAEMARYEWLRGGRIPLQTLRADIDFARFRAHLPYGDIGIKVWIYRGEVFNKNKNEQ
ncbi:30S ribosomal protein S3 [Candidatus Giovannonibacteria bacterium]|nr:30S ribosomal protein S3 [Candidatus Giovannonibacteria bacterium]